MIPTYRDPKTGAIYTQTGEKIPDPQTYATRVRTGEISGSPLDVSQMPSIQRDGAGVAIKTSPLTAMKGTQGFLEAAKEIIRRKQGMNKDISQQETYWRGLIRDTSPFGGAREPALTTPGMFQDKDIREMSPEDQASIRAARYGAATSHLEGLGEERKYRETQMSDTVKALTDMMEEKDKLAKNELDKTEQLLNIAKKKQDLGIEPTAEDLGLDVSKGIGDRIGGSVSWRHNNPGNIKFGDFAKKYGAVQGQQATDGGYFAVFPDINKGKQAMKELLLGKNYKDLDLDKALRKWSGNGYGVKDLYGVGFSTTISMLEKGGQLNGLIDKMVQREGWKEGKYLTSKSTDLALTEASKTSLMSKAGLTNTDVKGYSEDDWISLSKVISESIMEEAFEILAVGDNKTPPIKDKIVIRGQVYDNPSPDLVKAELIRKYPELQSDQIDSLMLQAGFTKTSSALMPTWQRP